ncbi:MAG: hypothetical protein PHI59_04795 [Candidatus Omnitrophica bacterium]|nr:hypothetical protein [Candidatus Omnitrophota bacterium]
MNPKMLEESKIAMCLIGFYEKSKSIVGNLIRNSKTANISSGIKQGFFSKPVRSASIFLFTAVTVNIVLNLMLRKQMDPFDLTIKGAVLLVSLGGFFCEAGWHDIKKNSFILSKIFK